MTWDDFFMGLAQYVSQKSKDRSRKVGAVSVDQRNVVLSLGWNGFPRGVNDDVEERHQRPLKYLLAEHAERNLCYNAASKGISLSGAKMYVTWYPCCDCARAIIQSDISELVCMEPNWDDSVWAEQFRISKEMLAEAGVKVRFVGKFEQKPT
jgi:dCMP deaminase